MPCDSIRRRGQSFAQRREEVRRAADKIAKLVAAKKVKVKVGPQGAVNFTGISDDDRTGMTDACIYRMLSRSGSPAVKMAFMQAEQLAGRGIDKSQVAAGMHSHDGGSTWHPKG